MIQTKTEFKDDIKETRDELKGDIKETRTELKGDIKAVDGNFKGAIEKVIHYNLKEVEALIGDAKEVNDNIGKTKAEPKDGIKEVKAGIKEKSKPSLKAAPKKLESNLKER